MGGSPQLIKVTNPIKTLIADDHELVRAGLRDALSGIPELEIVGEVSNGPELFASIKRMTPDLLVMDVNMPD
ncbi:response regulator transcription factor, partial [bacterium]|nr:response regulator transcription factor [bacterium]